MTFSPVSAARLVFTLWVNVIATHVSRIFSSWVIVSFAFMQSGWTGNNFTIPDFLRT